LGIVPFVVRAHIGFGSAYSISCHGISTKTFGSHITHPSSAGKALLKPSGIKRREKAFNRRPYIGYDEDETIFPNAELGFEGRFWNHF
jgi:hypothetical protein